MTVQEVAMTTSDPVPFLICWTRGSVQSLAEPCTANHQHNHLIASFYCKPVAKCWSCVQADKENLWPAHTTWGESVANMNHKSWPLKVLWPPCFSFFCIRFPPPLHILPSSLHLMGDKVRAFLSLWQHSHTFGRKIVKVWEGIGGLQYHAFMGLVKIARAKWLSYIHVYSYLCAESRYKGICKGL